MNYPHENKVNFEYLSTPLSILVCLFMASFYVISLYLWSHQNRYNRNDPSVIKRRFISVTITSILSFLIVYMLADNRIGEVKKTGSFIHEWIGFRIDLKNLVLSISFSMILTVILFLGPLVQHFVSNYLFSLSMKLYERKNNDLRSDININELNTLGNLSSFCKSEINSVLSLFTVSKLKKNFSDFCFLRNYLVSPFTEEFVFRSCMLPLLIHNLGLAKSIFLTPLFFGLAHLHHIIEGVMNNESSLKFLLVQHCFQFAYTYIFGVYSSYLFLRTGNFFASFLSHSFCNLMGFPNFAELLNEFVGKTKLLLIVVYILGFVCFFSFIWHLTDPSLFDNHTFVEYY